MKQGLIFSVVLLLSTLIIAVIPTEAEARIYEDTVRLHILANSNSEKDQDLKLEIRDRIIDKYGAFFKKAENAEGAVIIGKSLLCEIEKDCESWINDLGYNYSVSVTLTEEWYDTRIYESFTLPSGIYSSLRIIIGEGNGQNWWCVMYPPLCTDIALEKAPMDDCITGYDDREISLIKNDGYNVKFKSLELLSKVFCKK